MIFVMVIVFIVIAAIDAPKLFADRQWKDLAVYSFFYIAALTLVVLQYNNIDIPSPIKGLEVFFREIIQIYYKD